jgi:hypothetical protein
LELDLRNENTAVGYGIADYVNSNEFSADLKCGYKWKKGFNVIYTVHSPTNALFIKLGKV